MATYPPLRLERDIRLLVIRPSTAWQSPIFCELRAVDLARDQVFFEVLFPVASTPAGPQGYIVFSGPGGGARHPLPANLESALRAMRHRHETRLLWVEAVCVNQTDLIERDVHRQMTMRIYRAAGGSISWVGEAEVGPGTNSHEAMRIVRVIGRWAEQHQAWLAEVFADQGRMEEEMLGLALHWRRIDWRSLMRLAERMEEAGAHRVAMPAIRGGGNGNGNGEAGVFRGRPNLLYCGRFRVPRAQYDRLEWLFRAILRRVEMMDEDELELMSEP